MEILFTYFLYKDIFTSLYKMEKGEHKKRYDELLETSYKLLILYNYVDDEDCKLHHDDFMHFITEDLDSMMKSLKDRYYSLYKHRAHQRC